MGSAPKVLLSTMDLWMRQTPLLLCPTVAAVLLKRTKQSLPMITTSRARFPEVCTSAFQVAGSSTPQVGCSVKGVQHSATMYLSDEKLAALLPFVAQIPEANPSTRLSSHIVTVSWASQNDTTPQGCLYLQKFRHGLVFRAWNLHNLTRAW